MTTPSTIVKKRSNRLYLPALALLAALITLPITKASFAANDTATETKKVTLIGKDGSRLEIASVTLTKTEQGEKISINFIEDRFSEHFLSMRPFKCIDGDQTLCHLPYPYKTKDIITKDNLMDLEYKLLFIHKGAGEYGINFWNGVYYRLKREDDGSFTGVVWETDMDELAAPPEVEYSRPIGGDDLSEGAEGKHRYPLVEIK